MASRTALPNIMFRWSNNIEWSYAIKFKNGRHLKSVLRRSAMAAAYGW